MINLKVRREKTEQNIGGGNNRNGVIYGLNNPPSDIFVSDVLLLVLLCDKNSTAKFPTQKNN